MSWLIQTFSSSVGKKLLMAVTGLSFIGFLAAHLAGNLTLYAGGAAFNAYAEKLHSLGPILTVFELGLLVLALIHVATGITLFVQNYKARSVPYEKDEAAGGRTWSSVTMPYTGFIILGFVVFPTHRLLKRRKGISYSRHLKRLLFDGSQEKISASVQGWINHVRYGDTYGLRKSLLSRFGLLENVYA